MQAMTDYLASFKSEMHETMFGILNRKRDFELETDKTKAESAFLAAQSYAETLAEEMRVAEEAFKESAGRVSEGRELSDEIETLTDRLAVLDQRISEVHLEAKAPIFLSVEQLATTPMTPLGDNFGKLLAMIFAASFALVGGSVISFEFLDGRVRAPGDVKAALGAMPLDPVPFVASESTDQDFAKIVSQDPKSSAAGAIRRAIVRLNTEREQNDAKVFCFTGVAEHNGVSSFVSIYADGFYHYTDRVLIIEFVDEGEELPADGGNENGQRPSAPNNGDESATAEAVLNNLPEEGGWVGKISFARQSGIVRKRSEIVKLIATQYGRVRFPDGNSDDHCGLQCFPRATSGSNPSLQASRDRRSCPINSQLCGKQVLSQTKPKTRKSRSGSGSCSPRPGRRSKDLQRRRRCCLARIAPWSRNGAQSRRSSGSAGGGSREWGGTVRARYSTKFPRNPTELHALGDG